MKIEEVADLDFPEDANPRGDSVNLLFVKIFCRNCMKIKEVGLFPLPPRFATGRRGI